MLLFALFSSFAAFIDFEVSLEGILPLKEYFHGTTL
jgi:hypothetical protein